LQLLTASAVTPLLLLLLMPLCRLKPKKVKNITHNEFGDTLGRIHLGRQDLSSMQVRRVKALRSSGGKRKRGEDEQPQENQEGDAMQD
jgi:ribosome production factor 2